MRQMRFAVLMTLTVVGLTAGPGLAQFTLEPADVSTDSQEMRLVKDAALSQSAVGQSLVMAQSTAQKNSVKNDKNPAAQAAKPKPEKPAKPKPDKTERQTSDRMAHYECLEYCVLVRQSCEGLATIQPDIKIAAIGSRENNKWSRECQKIYNGLMKKCNIDEKKIHWKRSKIAERRNKKKESL